MGSRVVDVKVVYCDEYLGYTMSSWLEEVRDIVEEEHCVRLSISSVKECGAVDMLDPVLLLDGEIVVEGVPGEPGYLIELLKKRLLDKGLTCNGGVD